MNNPFFTGWMFGLGLAMAFYTTVVIIGLAAPSSKDDSDPLNGRSGVAVVTDYKTGLQYLKAPGGGVTPRLTVDGEHMREGE